jgi:hypothetical protein
MRSREVEVTIKSGPALLWKGAHEGWESCSIEEAAENFAYVWDEEVQGATVHIFRHLKNARRYAQQ